MESDPGVRVVLVTGGAQRIGAAIVRALHAAGYVVALHYGRSRAAADALVAELDAQRPESVAAFAADLAQASAAATLVDAVVARFGRLDALVNNAALFKPTPVGAFAADDVDALFAVNARAPLLLAQATAPHLRRACGAIVNLGDFYAEQPQRDHAVYVMTKAAIAAMTRALALDLAPQVRVNAVAPGAILWPEQGKPEADQQRLLAQTALARVGEPADIAAAVLYLLRDAAYVTGQVLHVDGGRSRLGI